MNEIQTLVSWGMAIFFFSIPLIHIALAFGLFGDASGRLDNDKDLRFLWPSGWALTGLVFGLAGALIYWLLHYSAFDAAALRENLDQADGKLRITMTEPKPAGPSARPKVRKPLLSSSPPR